jgi:transposase
LAGSVLPAVCIPSAAASRSPAAPPNAGSSIRNVASSRTVWRAYGAATAGSRSVKMACGRSGASQKKHRVRSRVRTPCAPERARARNRERHVARYEQVVALHAAGLSKLAISRRTGVSRHTIIRWLAVGHFPERRDRAARPTTLTPHIDFLRARWMAGCHNATRLSRELREQRGFQGGRSAVRDWV